MFRQRHNTSTSTSGKYTSSVSNGSLHAFAETLCDYLMHKRCVFIVTFVLCCIVQF